MSRLSVVIPTLDAAAVLAQTLECVAGADEILVIDGGSKDATAAVAADCGARLILGPTGRGTQLRLGGAAAEGDWLLFLHADTRPGPHWREAVAAHVRRFPGKAACFRFRLDDASWQARAVEMGVDLRVRLFGLPYGDQGLLVPRPLYEAVGGYRALPLMEDVDLVRRIGRRRLRVLDEDAVTSAERWRREGWLKRSASNLLCLALWRAGVSPDRIAKIYG